MAINQFSFYVDFDDRKIKDVNRVREIGRCGDFHEISIKLTIKMALKSHSESQQTEMKNSNSLEQIISDLQCSYQ
jgi:hypothetical protein